MFPREVNDNRIDEEKIKNYTENELYYYFTDEKSIYAFFSDDIKVYPKTEHNIMFCEKQIATKIEIIRQAQDCFQQQKKNAHPVEKIKTWFLEIKDSSYHKYWENIIFLTEHIPEENSYLATIIEEEFTVDGEEFHLESPFATSNVFSVEHDDLDNMAKTLQKEMSYKGNNK